MRGIIIVTLIGIGIAALVRHSLVSRLRLTEQTIERFTQMPAWSPFRMPDFHFPSLGDAVGPVSQSDPDHSRYV